MPFALLAFLGCIATARRGATSSCLILRPGFYPRTNHEVIVLKFSLVFVFLAIWDDALRSDSSVSLILLDRVLCEFGSHQVTLQVNGSIVSENAPAVVLICFVCSSVVVCASVHVGLAEVRALRHLRRGHVKVRLELSRLELFTHGLGLVDHQGCVCLLRRGTGAALGCIDLLLIAPWADSLGHGDSVVLLCPVFVFDCTLAWVHPLAIRPYDLFRADHVASWLNVILA